MKKKSIILSILGAVLLTVLIVVALLPGIVSSDMMNPYVMQAVSQQIPGQIQVQAWSLSWFGTIEIKEIVYDNRQDNLLARIAEIKTSSGLLDLILDRGNLGTVEVIDPAVVLYISEKTETPHPKDSQPAPQLPESKPKAVNETGSPALYGQFRITNGSLHSVAVDGDEKVIAKNLDAVLDAPGPQDPIIYQNKLKLHGSIGFDETLDFIARVPVTSKMVGKDAYQFLKGTTIKVPIRGSVAKPKVNQTAFQDATGDLMQQVLQKNVAQGVQNLFKNFFKKKE